MKYSKKTSQDQNEIRKFYNSVYYKDASVKPQRSRHYSRLASRINIQPEQYVLDVACGNGKWLLAVQDRGGIPAGIDLSEKAVAICKSIIPDGEIYAGSAEALPFEDKRFHIISCLGALEHFINPEKALQEFAQENNIPFLSMGHFMYENRLKVDEIQGLYYSNGLGHFTPDGHKYFANAIYACFYDEIPDTDPISRIKAADTGPVSCYNE